MMLTVRRVSLGLLVPVALALVACATTGPAQPTRNALNGPAIERLVAMPDRSLEDRKLDAQRKPAQLLAFSGVGAGMWVLDLSAGQGYTTDLLARATGPTGKAFGQSAPGVPPAAAPMKGAAPAGKDGAVDFVTGPNPSGRLPSPEALALRAQKRNTAHIVSVVQPFEAPVPEEATGKLDLVTLIYNYHDLVHRGVDRDRMNRAVFDALKPGGAFVIIDYAGREGAGTTETATLHRIEESALRQELERAGFKLQAQSDAWRNPADPRDRNMPLGGQAKDSFALKFVKP